MDYRYWSYVKTDTVYQITYHLSLLILGSISKHLSWILIHVILLCMTANTMPRMRTKGDKEHRTAVEWDLCPQHVSGLYNSLTCEIIKKRHIHGRRGSPLTQGLINRCDNNLKSPLNSIGTMIVIATRQSDRDNTSSAGTAFAVGFNKNNPFVQKLT